MMNQLKSLIRFKIKSKSINKPLQPEDRVKFDEKLLGLNLIDLSLESILLIHQRKSIDNVIPNKISMRKKLYFYSIKLCLFLMLAINFMKLLFGGDSFWANLIPDLSRFISMKPIYYRFFIINVSSVLIGIVSIYKNPKNLFWMTNFAHLQGLVSPKCNHIYSIKTAEKLIKLYKIMSFIVNKFVLMTVVCTLILTGTLCLISLTLTEYLMRFILWHFYFMGFWSYLATSLTMINLMYFGLICYYYKIRIDYLNNKLRNTLNSSSSSTNQTKLKSFLFELNRIMISIRKSNQFWSYFICIVYFPYIPLISFLINCLVVYIHQQNIIIIIIFTFCLIGAQTAVLYVAFNSCLVNNRIKKVAVQLYKILSMKPITTSNKIKV